MYVNIYLKISSFFTKDEFKKKEGQVFVRLYSDEKYFLNNHICLFSLILRAGSVNFGSASIYGHFIKRLSYKLTG